MSKLLSDDELGYFMDMESLFNHPGWARMSKEIQTEMKSLPEIMFATAKSWDDIQSARVRYTAIETLLQYPQTIEQRRASIERERQSMIDEVNEL